MRCAVLIVLLLLSAGCVNAPRQYLLSDAASEVAAIHQTFDNVRFGDWKVTELYEDGGQVKERDSDKATFEFVKPTIREWLCTDGCSIVLWHKLQGAGDWSLLDRDVVYSVHTDSIPGWTVASIEFWPDQGGVSEFTGGQGCADQRAQITFGDAHIWVGGSDERHVVIDSGLTSATGDAVWVGLRMMPCEALHAWNWTPPEVEQ